MTDRNWAEDMPSIYECRDYPDADGRFDHVVPTHAEIGVTRRSLDRKATWAIKFYGHGWLDPDEQVFDDVTWIGLESELWYDNAQMAWEAALSVARSRSETRDATGKALGALVRRIESWKYEHGYYEDRIFAF